MTNLLFPLVSKILSLLVLVGAGVVLVKTKLLKKEDSIALSKISVFLLSPCVIVSSFSMKVDGKAGQSLLLCFFLCHFGKLPFSLSRHFTQKAAAFKPCRGNVYGIHELRKFCSTHRGECPGRGVSALCIGVHHRV